MRNCASSCLSLLRIGDGDSHAEQMFVRRQAQDLVPAGIRRRVPARVRAPDTCRRLTSLYRAVASIDQPAVNPARRKLDHHRPALGQIGEADVIRRRGVGRQDAESARRSLDRRRSGRWLRRASRLPRAATGRRRPAAATRDTPGTRAGSHARRTASAASRQSDSRWRSRA